MPNDHVTVGIVGAGVAGLCLAKMLEMIGISYILFESYREIAPDSGASLGLMPNGLRILDQLGLADHFDAFTVAHDKWEHRDGNTGSLYKTSRMMRRYHGVFGYEPFFMARKDVLRVLYESLEDKSKIYTRKHVQDIESDENGATIRATDGTSFSCDFVAGADGVHSVVRQHIFAKTSSPSPDFLHANTTCVFGISAPLPGIGPGRHFTIYNHKVSALIFSGLNGKLYWFLFNSLDEPITYGRKAKFNETDIQIIYEKVASSLVTDGVRFCDVFDRRETALMTALEEGLSHVWNHNRAFLLGDSAHKMLPHAAMGANQAMESAASFVNHLRRALASSSGDDPKGGSVTFPAVLDCLAGYERERRNHVADICRFATKTCKNQLLIDSSAETFLSTTLPNITDDELFSGAVSQLGPSIKLENWEFVTTKVDTSLSWKELQAPGA